MVAWLIGLLVSLTSPSLWSVSDQADLFILFSLFVLSPSVAYLMAQAAIALILPPRTVSEALSKREWESVVQTGAGLGKGMRAVLIGLGALVVGLVLIGLVIWNGSVLFSAFSSAPWWAVVIIVLLVILILK